MDLCNLPNIMFDLQLIDPMKEATSPKAALLHLYRMCTKPHLYSSPEIRQDILWKTVLLAT